jgi:hypothetical protein
VTLSDLTLSSVALADLTREGARDAARQELSRQPYVDAQPPLLVRLFGKLITTLGEWLDRALSAVPGGPVSVAVLVLLVLALVAVVLHRAGPLARRGPTREALFAGSAVRTAQEHRELAETAAAQGRWADAVRERLRAVVRELESRGALDPQPGRTAGEVARDGGAAVPAIAGDLRRAAVLFDEVWYGGRDADAGTYAELVGVDERVRGSRLAVTSTL